MKIYISLFAAFVFTAAAPAESSDNCLAGCPIGQSPNSKTIHRDLYSLSHNPNTKIADWVAYRVRPELLDGPKPSRSLKRDPLIHERYQLTREDYKDAFDILDMSKGHLAPLGSVKGSPHVETVNFYSNIAPQSSNLNQGPWERLERAVRTLSKNSPDSEVFVVTGPSFDSEMPNLPRTTKEHTVPSAYWKLIAFKANGNIEVAAFYLPQTVPKFTEFCDYQISTDEVERATNLDFFTLFNDEFESSLEANRTGLHDELGCEW